MTSSYGNDYRKTEEATRGMREAGKCTHRGIVIKETNGQSGVGKIFLFLGPRMVGTELKISYTVKLFTAAIQSISYEL